MMLMKGRKKGWIWFAIVVDSVLFLLLLLMCWWWEFREIVYLVFFFFWIGRNCDVLLVLWLLLVEGRRWQKRKIIRCWWFSVVYNTPAIEWLQQYKKYQTLNTNRKDHISKRRKTYETKLRHFIVRGSKWKRKIS